MKNYGTVQSTVKPEALIVDDYSVWKNGGVKEVTVNDPETGEAHTEYSYEVIQYEKDEFIRIQADELTEAQKGLCELYEMMLQ